MKVVASCSPRPSVLRLVGVAASALWLGACVDVRFVDAPDPAIADGLTAYYEDVVVFLEHQARQGPDAPEAAHGAPESQAWYARQAGRLDTLILRARAAQEGLPCTGSRFVEAGIEGVLARLQSDLASLAPDAAAALGDADIEGELDLLGDDDARAALGSCTVVVLTAVRLNHDLLEAVHQSEGRLHPALVRPLRGAIEQGVRIALRNEMAKRRPGDGAG